MAAPRLRPHQTRRAASNLIRRWAHEGKHALTALDDPTKQRLMRCVTWKGVFVGCCSQEGGTKGCKKWRMFTIKYISFCRFICSFCDISEALLDIYLDDI